MTAMAVRTRVAGIAAGRTRTVKKAATPIPSTTATVTDAIATGAEKAGTDR